MSGPQEIQHQGAPNMGCVSQGSKRRQLALDGAEVGSIWVCGCGWMWPGWYSQGHWAVQASDPPCSTAKEVAGPTPVMRDPRTTSALYDWALVITTSQTHTRYKIYMHCFSAGQAEFQLCHQSFLDLLGGCSWLTTIELSHETMLRSMPLTVTALETKSPNLASTVGKVNSHYLIYEQAATIGEIQNLPTSTVIECSNRALRQCPVPCEFCAHD